MSNTNYFFAGAELLASVPSGGAAAGGAAAADAPAEG